MRSVGVALVTTLAAALLAGCGGSNPKPSPVASPSATASTSASPSAAPTMPAEAKGTTAASAEAFVRYYFEVYSYAARTGRTDTMKALVTDACASCLNSIELIEKTYNSGGYATGRGYEVSGLAADGPTRLRGTVIQFAQRLVPSQSASPTNFPQGTFQARFELTESGGSWKMTGLFVL